MHTLPAGGAPATTGPSPAAPFPPNGSYADGLHPHPPPHYPPPRPVLSPVLARRLPDPPPRHTAGAPVAATCLPNVFYANGLEPHASLYYETSSAIIALVLAGRFMEAQARAHTGDAIRALLALGAKMARVRRPGGVEEDVAIEQLKVGDIVLVRPGETIAADGLVVAGSSAVDESMLPGESIPRDKPPRHEVPARAPTPPRPPP